MQGVSTTEAPLNGIEIGGIRRFWPIGRCTRDKLTGWKVDTSGTPTKLRRNETEDTRFFPIALGLDWRF